MRKKILSGILVLAMMLTMIPTAFAANDKLIGFTTGDNDIWLGKLNDGSDTDKANDLYTDLKATSITNADYSEAYELTGTVKYVTMSHGGYGDEATGHFIGMEIKKPSDLDTDYDWTLSVDGMKSGRNRYYHTTATAPTGAPSYAVKLNKTDLNGPNPLVVRLENVTGSAIAVTLTYKTTEIGHPEKTVKAYIDVSKLTLAQQELEVSFDSSNDEISATPVASGTLKYFVYQGKTAIADVKAALKTKKTLKEVESYLGLTARTANTLYTADNTGYAMAVEVDADGKVLATGVVMTQLTGIGAHQTTRNLFVDVDTNAIVKMEVNKAVTMTGTTRGTFVYDGEYKIEVRMTFTVDPNYTLTDVTAKTKSGADVAIVKARDNKTGTYYYYFKAVNDDVTVTVTTKKVDAFAIEVNTDKDYVQDLELNASETAVTGTILYDSANWKLPLKLNMNTSEVNTDNITVDYSLNGGEAETVDYGTAFRNSGWVIYLGSDSVKTVKIVVKNGDTTLKTWNLDLSGVTFANLVSVDVSNTEKLDEDTLVGMLNSANLMVAVDDIEDGLVFTADALKALVSDSSKVQTVTFATEGGTITVDRALLEKLAAKKIDVVLTAEIDQMSVMLGGNNYGAVINITFSTKDGEEIEVKDSKITLELNFYLTKRVLAMMGNKFSIACVSSDGTKEFITNYELKEIYDDSLNMDVYMVKFTTTHLTMFYLTTEGTTTTPSTPNTGIPTIPGNVPGSTIVTPGKTDDNTENDLSMSYDDAVAYVAEMTDVNEDNWFYDAVVSAVQRGIIRGTSTTTFAPNSNMTLLQTLTVLARFDGQNVDGTNWDKDALAWAVETGMIDKAENESDISRERLVYMLYKFAKASGVDVSNKGDLKAFPDAADVSDWAVEAMTWAVSEGIISGIYGELKPADTTTRAQVVTVLTRYADVIAD